MKAANRELDHNGICDVGNLLEYMGVPYAVRLPVSALCAGGEICR